MDEEERALLAEVLRLDYFSLTWNFLETFVGMVTRIVAGSVALIGFALESIVESSSAAVLIWRLRNEGSEQFRRQFREELARNPTNPTSQFQQIQRRGRVAKGERAPEGLSP
jgi:hypothetical protein